MSALFDRMAARLGLSPEAAETWRERLRPRAPDGLSSRLLLLTVAFTLAVEALIMAPNLAAFHERWLRDRLQAAWISIDLTSPPWERVHQAANIVSHHTALDLHAGRQPAITGPVIG